MYGINVQFSKRNHYQSTCCGDALVKNVVKSHNRITFESNAVTVANSLTTDKFNNHLQLVHLCEVSFGCDKCDNKWVQSVIYKNILLKLTKLYLCKICGKLLILIYKRVAHVKEVHLKTEGLACKSIERL